MLTIRLKNSMKIINGSFVNMPSWKISAALFFIKPRLDRKIGGEKERKEEKRELGREREKKARRNQKIVLGKVFLARNQQETREKRRNKGTWETKRSSRGRK